MFSKFITIIRSLIIRIISSKSYRLNGLRIKKYTYIESFKIFSLGGNIHIDENAKINCKNSSNKKTLKIGNNVRIGKDVMINAYEEVIIEDDVVISDRVYISDATHNKSDINLPIINQGTSFEAPVLIKSGSWLGINSCIMPGTIVGRNSIIAANSVVREKVKDYSTYIGFPEIINKRN